jgi:hypothetical protein
MDPGSTSHPDAAIGGLRHSPDAVAAQRSQVVDVVAEFVDHVEIRVQHHDALGLRAQPHLPARQFEHAADVWFAERAA